MQVSDTSIPLTHGVKAVTSNLVYDAGALVVLGVAAWSQNVPAAALGAMVAFALHKQATGSMLYHATPGSARWAQLLDAVMIQWVMASLIGLSLVRWLPIYVIVPAVLVAWVLWWTEANHVRRNVAIGVQSALVLTAIGLRVGSLSAVLLLAWMLVAVAFQRRSDSHSWGHAVWHVMSSVGQTTGALLLI